MQNKSSHPESRPPFSRREFLAASSAALASTALSAADTDAPDSELPPKLALHGGEKTIQQRAKLGLRWGDPERQRLDATLSQDSLFYWKGPQTARFIKGFQQVTPLKHVMTCSSGTAALHIAVAAAGIGPGDEVITSPITDIGTVIGVLFQQGVPVFADLEASTYNLNPAEVERRITPRTKAIIAVHLGGNPCDMTALKAIAEQHRLVLIEDAAQAWGRRTEGTRSALSGTLPAGPCNIRNSSPVGTAVWWRPTTTASGRCCNRSATRVTTVSKAGCWSHLPPITA